MMPIIYDNHSNEKFISTLRSIQYNATFAVNGVIKRPYINEIGLELSQRSNMNAKFMSLPKKFQPKITKMTL